jgi:hypothetical protein
MTVAVADSDVALARAVRRYRSLATVLVVALVLTAAVLTWLWAPSPAHPLPSDDVALALTAAALLLILAASRVSALVTRRALLLPNQPAWASAVRGLLIGWIVLAIAGGLGLVAAARSRSIETAWVFVLAATVGILVRWPRQGALRRVRSTIR